MTKKAFLAKQFSEFGFDSMIEAICVLKELSSKKTVQGVQNFKNFLFSRANAEKEAFYRIAAKKKNQKYLVESKSGVSSFTALRFAALKFFTETRKFRNMERREENAAKIQASNLAKELEITEEWAEIKDLSAFFKAWETFSRSAKDFFCLDKKRVGRSSVWTVKFVG